MAIDVQQLKYDIPIQIAVGSSAKDDKWINTEINWSAFIQTCMHTRRTRETMADYDLMDAKGKHAVKDGRAFVGGAVIDQKRKKESMMNHTLILLDADHADDAFVFSVNLAIFDMSYLIYSTHSHRSSRPKMRLVIPLKRPVTSDEYGAIARKMADKIGMKYFDHTTFDPNRLMYFPSCSKDASPYFDFNDAPMLDPDSILAEFDNWRDVTTWPKHPDAQKDLQAQRTKLVDPRTKDGIIGQFCRAYTIEEGIADFLTDVYAPTDQPDRYTFIGGSTYGGMRIYNDGHAYSEHQTDPANDGHCHNLFDLIRIHKFKHLDDAINRDRKESNLPSMQAMIHFANNDSRMQRLREEEMHADFADDLQNGGNKAPSTLFFIEQKFIPKRLADWFLYGRDAMILKDLLYVYDSGRYVYGEKIFREMASRKLGDEYSIRRVTEALYYMKDSLEKVAPDEAVSMGNKLNLKNGLLDLDTFEFTDHTTDLRTIVQLPVTYNPSATCPSFDEYIRSVVPEDSVPLIEEMLGYCLMPTMKYEKAFLLQGEGGNGKGTLISIIGSLLGYENVSNVALQVLSDNRFAVAQLYGKLVNLHADIPGRLLEDSSLFKELVSGDKIAAEEKYKEPFSFSNRAKLIFSANEMPASKDNTDGYHRRWMVIPFPNKFNNGTLRKKLFEDHELSGILNVAIRGIKRLVAQNGFSDSASSAEHTEKYRSISDSSYHFLKEMCSENEHESLSKQEVFNAYRLFCDNWNLKPISQTKFNQKLRLVYPDVKEDRNGQKRKWRGLSMELPEKNYAEFDYLQ